MKNEDKNILVLIKRGNEKAFKDLFDKYYRELYYFALTYFNQKETAEEIVQEVFIHIWNKRYELEITTSFKSYLFTSVKNRSIDYIRKELRKPEKADEKLNNLIVCGTADSSFEISELETLISKAILSLPEKCRIIFNLSRNSGLTYKEIANEFNISTETVKTQISIALKKIKLYLEIYWELVYN